MLYHFHPVVVFVSRGANMMDHIEFAYTIRRRTIRAGSRGSTDCSPPDCHRAANGSQQLQIRSRRL